jgi:hypothetical protein
MFSLDEVPMIKRVCLSLSPDRSCYSETGQDVSFAHEFYNNIASITNPSTDRSASDNIGSFFKYKKDKLFSTLQHR